MCIRDRLPTGLLVLPITRPNLSVSCSNTRSVPKILTLEVNSNVKYKTKTAKTHTVSSWERRGSWLRLIAHIYSWLSVFVRSTSSRSLIVAFGLRFDNFALGIVPPSLFWGSWMKNYETIYQQSWSDILEQNVFSAQKHLCYWVFLSVSPQGLLFTAT